MARGPKPQPAAVKRARGSSRRPIVEDTPPAVAGAADGAAPPTWLKPKRGLEEWNRLSPILRSQKLLTPADATAFARYCRNLALWNDLRTSMDEEGVFYESESNHGKLKRLHPGFLAADRLERQMLATEDRFGLNPAERQRIYAARAAGGVQGDLLEASRADDDIAAKAARPEQPVIGMLN